MSSFKEAVQKFTTEVASAYGKRAAELKVVPPSEDIVGFDDMNTGDLIAFEATAGDLRVRGLASKTAIVLPKKADYGPLFQAAHALDAGKSLSAQDLAARIVWTMGPDFALVTNVSDYPKHPLPAKVTPPTLERAGGGAVLHFFYKDQPGHGGAPATPFAAEVKCSADFKAQLTTSPGP